MEQAFAEMKSITLPRAGGTEQQSEFVCVNGRTFQVPRGKAVEVPELADGTYRVHGKSGEFLCLSRAENGTLTSIKNFFGA